MEVLDFAIICDRNDCFRFEDMCHSKYWPKFDQINKAVVVNELETENIYPSETTNCLCIASEHSDFKFVVELVNHGARTLYTDGHQDTPLHRACRSKIETLEKVLFLFRLDPFQLIKKNRLGQTPLHYVAMQSDTRLCKALLKFDSIDINVQSNQKQTPLHIAIKQRNLQVAHLLLDQISVDVNLKDLEGNTVLHYAAKEGNLKVLSFMKSLKNCDAM